MSTFAIHQYAAATATGDGVTTGIFITQKLLQQLGYHSEIFSSDICNTDNNERALIKSVDELQPEQTDLLLIHHSMGHDFADVIENSNCPKVMLYHNITPEQFFAEGSPERSYSVLGRKQLASWPSFFSGAIGMSPYNSEELEQHNYSNIATLPLLLELDRFSQAKAEHPVHWPLNPWRPMIISVGRISENKRQHLLIEALWQLKQQLPYSMLPQLLIVGGTTSPAYDQALSAHIQQLNLQHDVIMPGKCSDGELRWLYENAECYWCASAHEGFCIPLVEAGYFQVPVVSFASSNIPSTLGEAGLVIKDSNPLQMASVTRTLLLDPSLQQQVVDAGQRNLDRYRFSTLLPQLQQYLHTINSDFPIS